MNWTKLKDWKTRMTEAGRDGVPSANVSHSILAWPTLGNYSTQEKQFLMDLAQRTVREVVRFGKLPDVAATAVEKRLTERKGCFVTLTLQGNLRGCIGHIIPQAPLYHAVMDNARNAATRDHRFSPVTNQELDGLDYEISVLTEPRPVEFHSPDELLEKLCPPHDGVVLRMGSRSATFLPQVWHQIPDQEQFLSRLAAKAGCAPSEWRRPGASVSVFRVEAFKDSELR